MFPPAPESGRSAPRPLRVKLRNAADLAIAFMTLESYGLDDLRPARFSGADGPFGAPVDDAATHPGEAPDARAAAGTTLAHSHRRELRAHSRARRPGTVVLREQPCTTPLAGSTTVVPRRRTAPQDKAAS